MIKAVLLDLDNTLVFNPEKAFVLEYLRLLDGYFNERRGYPRISRLVLEAVGTLRGKRDMQRSNTDVMLTLLAARLGVTADALRAAFDVFYRDVYPALERCVDAIPDARQVVAGLQKRGYQVIVATNPLYPAEAIRQRLMWAGLPDSLAAYAFVTHSDNMHAVKPDPAYYAEIVARADVEPDEAVMVGDDLTNDITAAATAGLRTFHVSDTANGGRVAHGRAADKTGTLVDFLNEVIDGEWFSTIIPSQLTAAMVDAELRGNIGALFGLLAEVQPHYWNQHPLPTEWSIMEIVCHLLESERVVQRSRLEKILNERNPFLVNPRQPPGPQAQPCADDGLDVARKFTAERLRTLELLDHIQPEDWGRPARHSIFGPTTLLEMAHFTAQHDRLHLTQLCQTLGFCD